MSSTSSTSSSFPLSSALVVFATTASTTFVAFVALSRIRSGEPNSRVTKTGKAARPEEDERSNNSSMNDRRQRQRNHDFEHQKLRGGVERDSMGFQSRSHGQTSMNITRSSRNRENRNRVQRPPSPRQMRSNTTGRDRQPFPWEPKLSTEAQQLHEVEESIVADGEEEYGVVEQKVGSRMMQRQTEDDEETSGGDTTTSYSSEDNESRILSHEDRAAFREREQHHENGSEVPIVTTDNWHSLLFSNALNTSYDDDEEGEGDDDAIAFDPDDTSEHERVLKEFLSSMTFTHSSRRQGSLRPPNCPCCQ